jgi:ABC-type branched-subunit amino acid transport system substrate-binding protein
MSYANVAASTTTTLQVTPVTTASESPQLKMFVRSAMAQYGLTEQEVKKRAVETYGSLEYAMQAMETAEAENKAAIERAFPNGYAEIQVGVSAVAFLNLKTVFRTCSQCSVNLNPEKR